MKNPYQSEHSESFNEIISLVKEIDDFLEQKSKEKGFKGLLAFRYCR